MEKNHLFILVAAILALLFGTFECNENIDQAAGHSAFAITEFPNVIGMKWIYTVYDSSTGRTDTATVSIVGNIELPNDASARMCVTSRGVSRDTTYVVVKGNTIQFSGKQLSHPQVFVFPLEVGSSWGSSVDSTTVVGIDMVETPLGEFNESFHVWRRVLDLNYGLDTHIWLVPHVGIIMHTKHEYDFTPPVRETWVLVSKAE